MQPEVRSIRTFIGAKEYAISRAFYKELGFSEIVISGKLSLFETGSLHFYLQDYYIKDWVDNTMVLLEVKDVNAWWHFLQQLELDQKYPGTRLIPVQENGWGKECLLTDPSGVLWHFAQFSE